MPSGGGAGRFGVRTGLPLIRRGASLPSNPCSFVDEHHALGPESAFLQSGVVLHSPQALVPSSTGTTPPGPNRLSSNPAWCVTSRKPLFLRRRAPRPRARTGLPPIRRGASLPANPCSVVDGHHAPGPEPAFLQSGVVLHSLQALVPSSTGTTPPGRPHLHRRWKRLGRFLLPPPKSKRRIARYVQCVSSINDILSISYLNNPICVPFPPRLCGLR